MGMYLADMTTGCALAPQTCAQSQGSHTLLDIIATPSSPLLAAASFDFQVQHKLLLSSNDIFKPHNFDVH